MAYLEPLIGAAAAFLVGFAWYTVLFGEKWRAYTGMTEEQANEGAAMTHGLAFLMMAIIAFGINFIVNMHTPEEQTFVHGGFHGLMIGLMYCLPAMTIQYLYQKKKLGHWLIDGGFVVVFCTIAGAVMAALKLG